MSMRGNVNLTVVEVCILSAIFLGIQIAYEWTLSPGQPAADISWGTYALYWVLYACFVWALQKSSRARRPP